MGASLRGAINKKCKDCTYDPHSGLGNWRQQTEGCTVRLCALWPVRPISKPSKVTESEGQSGDELEDEGEK